MASKEPKKPTRSAKPLALGKPPKPQKMTSKVSFNFTKIE
jgi:hypothetical protein